ncbi:MaoC/PaaZ C-terminal domain-containing protein [Hahella aquimaris]|uniref:MaoC/PaaZ C-terminal domain-containing protein n=1 Tax=Hahella sp. HNIBRBA332 TaxID=3015983 RepID=UPI00273CD8DF|nr:MaoC/PaaZ C-terminal domain-containing protein [Hahella sp. HNIBRBA332]WLQ11604.1 MaoC/PaaZ C-terminal domain-containing protein [Hahella sp. HNIBRBA332]
MRKRKFFTFLCNPGVAARLCLHDHFHEWMKGVQTMAKSMRDLQVGENLGESRWVRVDQALIDQFADCTRDRQWIHVDEERCRRESPYGQPIAHGFLALSLLPGLLYELISPPEGDYALINYGLEQVRFLEAVRSGDEIRLEATLESIQQKPSGTLYRINCAARINHREKPALAAALLVLCAELKP